VQMIRIIYVAIILFLLTLGWTSTSTAQVFADADCGKPMGSLNGVPARSNASDTTSRIKDCGDKPPGPNQPYPTTSVDGDPFQCVEYVRRYYRVALGINSQEWPHMNAGEFFKRHADLGLDAIPNGNTEPPKESDIVVLGSVPGNPGHVAIVMGVIGDRVEIIEQNWNRYTGYGELRRRANKSGWDLYRVLNSGVESEYKVLGWLRRPSSSVSDWSMFQHDPQQTGNSSDTSISVPLTQRWTYPAGSLITSSPTIANGTVYIGTADGKVHAVDSTNRTVKWVYDSGIGPTLWSAALVVNDKVYIASNGGGTSGLESSYLYVLKVNPSTTGGERIQKVLLGSRSSGQIPPSSPVLVSGNIYVGSLGQVWAIDAQTFAAVSPYPISVPDGLEVDATPAVTQNSVIVGTFGGNMVYAFDRVSGKPKWSASVNAPYVFPAPSTANGIVYVRSGGAGYAGEIIAYDENTGAESWPRQPVGPVALWGSPAIAGGVVYTSSETNVYAFGASDGQSKWPMPGLAQPGACGGVGINYSFFAVGNGLIFIKAFNGASGGACAFTNVFALKTTDGSPAWDSGLLSTAGVPAGSDYSTPSIANGWLFFGAGSTLYGYSP
jgi:outer membrane protein assembly factor BamB